MVLLRRQSSTKTRGLHFQTLCVVEVERMDNRREYRRGSIENHSLRSFLFCFRLEVTVDTDADDVGIHISSCASSWMIDYLHLVLEWRHAFTQHLPENLRGKFAVNHMAVWMVGKLYISMALTDSSCRFLESGSK